MSYLRFDEGELIRQLEKLSPRLRAAFAAACAERLQPAYARFAGETGRGAPGELASMLERLWRDLVGDPMSADRAREYISRSEVLTPTEDDGEWIAGQAQAEDAAVALTYALECLQGGGAREAAWAGRRAYASLDEFVIDREDIDTNRPGAEDQVLSDALIQAELLRQRRDLEDLLCIRDPGQVAGAVARIRDRAKAAASQVFD